MKRCPYCFESVQAAAIKCRYCGEWLNRQRGGRTEWWRWLLAGIVLIVITVLVIGTSGGSLVWVVVVLGVGLVAGLGLGLRRRRES